MGEVYRARDHRLGRDVAIKVLPARLASDPEAVARFEREARAVAALSHPNILAIHDIGTQNGTAYAVTEMLEGRTLRAGLDGGPLSPRKALDYAAQIARGLAAAHDKGIVHRDLKPENIFVTGDGQVKILDFGLAKVAPAEVSDLTASPTVDAGTRPGTVMGTMGYMSPEQVRGMPVDHRSDIFAFGAILYEMLSGRMAFRRDTPADTMSAILKEEPPALPPAHSGIAPALTRLVDHCLEKNPAERFQSARDLTFHLEAVSGVSSSGALASAPAGAAVSSRTWRAAGLVLGGIGAGLLLGAVAGARLGSGTSSTPPTLRYLSYSGKDAEPSASPDGRLIAYTTLREGRSQIWLKQFPGGDEVALTGGPDDSEPRVSPDGSQVLFTRADEEQLSLYRIPVVGGEPRKIIEDARSGDWSPDGKRIAFLRDEVNEGGLLSVLGSVDVSGQESREITRVPLTALSSVRWSPDGRTLACVTSRSENSPETILLVDASGQSTRSLIPPPPEGRLSSLAWMGSGAALVYAQSESFVSATSSQEGGRVMVQDVASGKAEVRMWLPTMAREVDILRAGTLVMAVPSLRQNLAESALQGAAAAEGPRWLTRGQSVDRQPVFSPDGQWVLFTSSRGGNLDLWKISMESGAIRRITEDPADDWDPAFTRDGRSILWSSNRGGHFEIWTCAADGTGARQLSRDGVDAENPTTTPGDEWIVYNSTNPAHSGVWKMRADGSGAARIVAGTWSTPEVSPDGVHVAFRSGTLPRRLLVARVDNGQIVGAPIMTDPGAPNARARWTPEGRSLVYTDVSASGAHGLFIQTFSPGGDSHSTKRPFRDFLAGELPESFGVSPDGSRVVYALSETLDSLMLAQGLPGIDPARGRRAP